MTLRTTDEVIAFLIDTSARADRGLHPEPVGVFARAYLRVTLEVVARIADGYFEDPSWLAAFDVRFANKYKEALENAAGRPGPWKIAFDVAASGDRDLLRHLMLGINAHMRYDLTAVLLGGFVFDRAKNRRDFDAVNRVMRLAIDPIQAVLEQRYAPWLEAGDSAALGLDEEITYQRFFAWRSGAWDDAMAVLDGRRDVESVERKVRWRAELLRRAPGLLTAALPF
ncbi:MAG TPA: DUF5995 family protein [Polyangiaceae bacterium]|jgi:hypothetical protein|nr:DUF5995 family protein [Polyangiaceae bacterium]